MAVTVRDDNGVALSRSIMPSGSILNAWHLITCTWDAETGEAVIYLDGLSTGRVKSGLASKFPPWQYPLLIGARQERGNVDWFYHGAMDDHRLYNYPLDGYEVAQLYTSLTGTTICVEYPAGDLNHDCVVDGTDVEILHSAWLHCGLVPATACEYNLADIAPLLTAWLDELGAGDGI